MKIKIDMKKTYKITLPKGVKVNHTITQNVNGVLEVTVNMEQKYVPKDGDVVYDTSWLGGAIAIYAGTNSTGCIMTYAVLYKQRLQTEVCEKGWGYTSDYRPATKAEKQRLFDALAKEGKRWNAEKKCVEDLPRWRTDYNKTYLYISSQCSIIDEKECGAFIDESRYNVGNYFRTREAAEKVAEQIRDIFKNSKAE